MTVSIDLKSAKVKLFMTVSIDLKRELLLLLLVVH